MGFVAQDCPTDRGFGGRTPLICAAPWREGGPSGIDRGLAPALRVWTTTVRSRAISFVNAYDPFTDARHYAALTCGDPRPRAYSPLIRPRVPSRAHPHNPDGK